MDSEQGKITESEPVRETQSHDPSGQGEADAGPVADPVANMPCQKRKKKKIRQKQSISLAAGEVSAGAEDMKDVPADTDQPQAAEGVPAKPKKKNKKRKLQTEAQLTGAPSLPSVAQTTPSQLPGENLPKEESEAKADEVGSKPAKKRKAKILQNDDAIEDQKGSSDKTAVQNEALQDGAQSTDAGTNSVASTDPECLKVCAANLPYWFDKTRIWRHFRRAGEVQHVWLLWDKWSGESRGIAFVTFADKASVKAALEYDGTSLAGNVIRVNLATDKSGDDSKAEASSAASGGWGGGGSWGTQSIQENPHYGQNKVPGKGKSKGGKARPAAGVLALADKPQGSLGLMARGLAFSVTEADLKSLFGKCGSGPTRVRVLVDKVTGESKGKAFIDFADEEALKQAVALNETVLQGRPLRLEFSRAAE